MVFLTFKLRGRRSAAVPLECRVSHITLPLAGEEARRRSLELRRAGGQRKGQQRASHKLGCTGENGNRGTHEQENYHQRRRTFGRCERRNQPDRIDEQRDEVCGCSRRLRRIGVSADAVNMANSYSRDPWVRTFINIETAVIGSYLDDSYQSSQYPVSILRYEKGDRRLMDYAPVFFPQTMSEPHGVNPPHPVYWIRSLSFAAGAISAHAQRTATFTGSGSTFTLTTSSTQHPGRG